MEQMDPVIKDIPLQPLRGSTVEEELLVFESRDMRVNAVDHGFCAEHSLFLGDASL